MSLFTKVCISEFHDFSYRTDYAVQPRPIEFSTVPQSQRVVEGDSVRLICNFSVTSLGSKYPKPHTVWRKNGTHIELVAKGGYSVLELAPVTPEHAGYYECLAVDGKKRLERYGKGHYITSSPRAYLDVVCKFRLTVNLA